MIPQEVLDQIMHILCRKKLKNHQIERKHIRSALKTLGLRKYYENLSTILFRITGKKPPILSHLEQQTILKMFNMVQGPFEKFSTRKNFLSYSFILTKFGELMKLNDDFMSCFSLLKGKDKLAKQDAIWKKICDHLGWRFFPSV